MGDQDDRHALVVAEGVQPIQNLTPPLGGDDRPLAVGKFLGIVLGLDLTPDKVLKPVERVKAHGVEAVLLLVQRLDGRQHIARRSRQREVVHRQTAEAVLGQDEDGVRRTGGEGGLADTFHAIDHHTRCGDGIVLADALKIKGHWWDPR